MNREIMRKDSQATPLHQIPALPVISYGSVSLFVKMELIDNTSFVVMLNW